ncbi:hypothetical protein [Polluticaenibacter yanchengensis]|uniref:DUF1700 domain-containing protein n=1 Tax=Polluticaenibacter yanchengensis TaxID=3014562 RepID=A0ABT4UR38_9BACT|nr:hypothetical protein [Chitinophagaceae bacterium LY-5]
MESSNSVDDKIIFLHKYVEELVKKRKSEEEIIALLQRENVETNYAETIIENVKSDLSDRKAFWIELVKGIILTMAGITLLYCSISNLFKISYLFYFIIWAIIVTGLSQIVRSFIIFRK